MKFNNLADKIWPPFLIYKSYNGRTQTLKKVSFLSFFQGFKQKYILKRIKKKYFAPKHYSVMIGKCDFVVNIFSWAISNNSFCELST